MLRVLLIHRQRTEHARMVRRLTGTNLFTDKDVLFVGGGIMACIGTTLTIDNLLCLEYA